MEKYKVKIFPIAQNDLMEMVDYINTLSLQAALAHYDFVVHQIGTLATLPERYPLCRDTQLRLRGYRAMPAKNYAVFYVVKRDTVEIRRILYTRRQYESLL